MAEFKFHFQNLIASLESAISEIAQKSKVLGSCERCPNCYCWNCSSSVCGSRPKCNVIYCHCGVRNIFESKKMYEHMDGIERWIRLNDLRLRTLDQNGKMMENSQKATEKVVDSILPPIRIEKDWGKVGK